VVVIDRPDAWGYISHSTINIGDDFQSVAAKRFLPADAVPVDREFIAAFTHPSKVKVLVNGWFMHQRGSYWDLPVAPPEQSWPPSPAIDPLFVSIHLTQTFHSTVFSAANIEYLGAHAPIGARDLYTLEALQAHGIPSYFSGCLTLTLPYRPTRRSDRVCLVDLDGPTIDYIRRRVRSPIAVMSHGKSMLPFLAPHHRLQYADYLLGVYRRARCVVTTRLHAALPCLAFETPVLLLASETPGWLNPRFRGLAEHVRHTSTEELTTGLVEYDFDAPPPNPGTHLPIRDQLVKAMTDWVDGRRVGWADDAAARPVQDRRDGHDPPIASRSARAALVTSLIRPGDVGVEIGVQVGAFAYGVLLQRRPSRLYLIDPWQYGLQGDVETDPTQEKQAGRDAEYRSVCERFAPFSNVEILRLRSEDAAARFADRSLDYVYIDGEHSFEAVTRDLTNYFPKVKVGGLLIGDDYGWTGVAPAVQAFLASRRDQVRFLVAPYTQDAAGQFVLRRVR
jgi:hypothetical protein